MRSDYSFSPPINIPRKKSAKVATTFVIGTYTAMVSLGGYSDSSNVYDFHNCDNECFIAALNRLIDSTNSISSIPLQENLHKERDYMLSRLDDFIKKLNTVGWDGYGAYPIQKLSYKNAVRIVKETPEEVLRLWNVFPSPNGTISFEFKAREVAAMSVGDNGFSYAAMKENEDPIMDEMDFDVNKASQALKKMSQLLGYIS